jgi:hypothetical protein
VDLAVRFIGFIGFIGLIRLWVNKGSGARLRATPLTSGILRFDLKYYGARQASGSSKVR